MDFVHHPLKINEELIETFFENWLCPRPQVIKNARGGGTYSLVQ
jgi:hypothetical protein